MWQQRVIYGTLLIVGLVGLFAVDARLSAERLAPTGDGGVVDCLKPVLLHGGLTTVLVAVAVVLGTREGCRLVRPAGHLPADHVILLAALALVLIPWLARGGPAGHPETAAAADWRWTGTTVAAATLLAAMWVMASPGVRGGTANTAVSVLLFLYVGFLAGFAVRLRMELGGPAGAWTLLYLLLVIKCSDIGAYAAGRWFGRTRVVPELSPNKTLEGFVGGVLLAVLVAWAGNTALLGNAWATASLPPLTPVRCAVLGAIMGIVAPLGDLFESLLKRDAGVKDSGRLRPFGGILDMIDSPLFAIPVGWWLLTNWARPG